MQPALAREELSSQITSLAGYVTGRADGGGDQEAVSFAFVDEDVIGHDRQR